MLYQQPAVQSMKHPTAPAQLRRCCPAARAAAAGCASETSPCCPWPLAGGASSTGSVPGTALVPEVGTRAPGSGREPGKPQLNRGRNCFNTALACSMVVAPASRGSVTNRSWKVPAVRSTRPCARGGWVLQTFYDWVGGVSPRAREALLSWSSRASRRWSWRLFGLMLT